jgi:hypothetical protein
MIKRLMVLLSVIAMAGFTTNALAGSFGVGVSGNLASVTADGKETAGDAAGAETENSVTNATAGNTFGFASVFAEYTFSNEIFTLGVDFIPGTADINSKTLSRTDATQGAYTAIQSGTVKANAQISDHITYYAELGKMDGIYGKLGFAQVDIDVKQTNAASYGTYPDKTLDAIVFGLGYKGGMGTNGYYKLEGFMYDYDQYSATSNSTNKNKVAADLDVTGVKFAIGYKF